MFYPAGLIKGKVQIQSLPYYCLYRSYQNNGAVFKFSGLQSVEFTFMVDFVSVLGGKKDSKVTYKILNFLLLL